MTQRVITVVGGGQSGLQLSLGLQGHGYEVRVIQNRTADDILTGRVLSGQCMFNSALQHERNLGLAFWETACPTIHSINFTVPVPDGSRAKVINWNGMLDRPAQSVDQRLKTPGCMNEFERRGERITIKEANIADLEATAAASDLVIVATGKGEVAITCLTGMTPLLKHSAVYFNLIPTVGEYFAVPALTTIGRCEIMVFEGIPGGPMDGWAGVRCGISSRD